MFKQQRCVSAASVSLSLYIWRPAKVFRKAAALVSRRRKQALGETRRSGLSPFPRALLPVAWRVMAALRFGMRFGT